MSKRQANNQYILRHKAIAFLSYLSFFCIIPLLFQRDNSFVLNHGKQGLVVFVGQVVSFILHIVLGEWFLLTSVGILLIYSLVGMINVLKGENVGLYLVSNIARKITL